MQCIEDTIDQRCTTWLSTPLPSTGLPPHFWITIDRATPPRVTNQAILIVGRDKDELAEMIVNTISGKLSDEFVSRICGVAVDGPYQAKGFRDTFLDLLSLNNIDNKTLALPITWDPDHLINLSVTDVRDANTTSGKHFIKFIKRCNVNPGKWQRICFPSNDRCNI